MARFHVRRRRLSATRQSRLAAKDAGHSGHAKATRKSRGLRCQRYPEFLSSGSGFPSTWPGKTRLPSILADSGRGRADLRQLAAGKFASTRVVMIKGSVTRYPALPTSLTYLLPDSGFQRAGNGPDTGAPESCLVSLGHRLPTTGQRAEAIQGSVITRCTVERAGQMRVVLTEPMPATVTVTVWPRVSGPTPAGVPV